MAHDRERRRFVLQAAAVAGLGAARVTRAATPAGTAPPLWPTSARARPSLRMTRGELTCERYAQALLERCAQQKNLNAFITLEPARVLEQARARDGERRAGAKPGPLFGLPIPVKDSVNTSDYPTTGGTPALRTFRPRPMRRWSRR